MKRRSQPKQNRTRGTYSAKMQSGNFQYGGYTNKNNDPDKPPRRCVAK